MGQRPTFRRFAALERLPMEPDGAHTRTLTLGVRNRPGKKQLWLTTLRRLISPDSVALRIANLELAQTPRPVRGRGVNVPGWASSV